MWKRSGPIVFGNENNLENNDLVAYSGYANHMIKDKMVFVELNKDIEAAAGCANKTESSLGSV